MASCRLQNCCKFLIEAVRVSVLGISFFECSVLCTKKTVASVQILKFLLEDRYNRNEYFLKRPFITMIKYYLTKVRVL